MKTIIAVDPGASGGIATKEGSSIFAISMPKTDGDILEHLQCCKQRATQEGFEVVAYIEKVGGYTGGMGAPGSAMFNFGEGCGYIRGVLMALGIRVVMVTPQKWQKHFSLGTAKSCASKTVWKNKLKQEAQRRFPQVKVTLSTADALLIMEYGNHLEKGGAQ